ncbi:MAG: transporter substrate-binding domain-containing protein [Bacteroidota bacterium]
MKYTFTTTLLLLCFFILSANGDGKYYGLFIAIDQYKSDSWDPLYKATDDAEAIRTVLEQQYKFETSVSLYNQTATREQILKTIDLVGKQISKDDYLVIFYSGHSQVIEEEGYWIPYDAGALDQTSLIPNSSIRTLVEKASAGHILIISDAFFKGDFMKISNTPPKDVSRAYFNKMRSLVSRQVMSSESVHPIFDENDERSVFVKYLLKFLKDNDRAELDANELFELIRIAISANSDDVPTFGYLQDTGHEGGQFIFTQEGGIVPEEANTGKSIPVNLEMDQKEIVEEDLRDVDVVIEEGDAVEFTHKGELNARADADNVVFNWYKNGFLISEESNLVVKSSGTYMIVVRSQSGKQLASSSTKVKIKERKYIVKIGDNLERIATLFYDDPEKASLISKANELESEDALLKVGTSIVIPNDVEDIIAIAKNLVVAGEDSFAPFSGAQLYNEGMLVEVVNRVFKEIGLECTTNFMGLNEAKAATINGQTLGVYPTLKNDRDENNFVYSDPIYKVTNVLFEKRRSNTDFSKPSKLRGKVVAVKRGYDIPELIELYKKGYIQIRPCRTLEDCFNLLQKEEVDLVATAQFVGLSHIKDIYGSTRRFNVVTPALGSSTLHFAVSKKYDGANQIVGEFNKFYSWLKHEGIVNDIQDRHIDRIQSEEEER